MARNCLRSDNIYLHKFNDIRLFPKNFMGVIFASLAITVLSLAALPGHTARVHAAETLRPTDDELRAAAVRMTENLGALLKSAGKADDASIAEAIDGLNKRLDERPPTLEEIGKLRSIMRGVVLELAADAEGAGDAARAAALGRHAADLAGADPLDGSVDRIITALTGAPTGSAETVAPKGSASTVSKEATADETTASGETNTEPTKPNLVVQADADTSSGAGAEPGPADAVTIVFDGSNSMWGQVDGRPKIEIAREALADLVSGWKPGAELGLIAFGHRREADCSDVETLRAPGPVDPLNFLRAIEGITPTGKSPITAAVRKAAEELGYIDRPTSVILFSDGVETCDADPCALAAELNKAGVRFTAHVIGFGVDGDASQLVCLAEATGGLYLTADNAVQLDKALSTLRTVTSEPEKANLIVLEAVSPGGQVIRENVVWRVASLETEEAVAINAGVARPALPLDAGRYVVEARVGEITGRVEIEVVEGTSATHRILVAVTAKVTVTATEVPVNETENNDTFGRANTVPSPVVRLDEETAGTSFANAIPVSLTGRIATTIEANKPTWRRIDAKEQGALSITTGAVPIGSRAVVRLWNAEKSTLTSWLDFVDGTATVDLAEPGQYILEIRVDKAGGNLQIDLAFAETGDVFEPNATFGRAAALDLSEPFEIAILPRADQDWFWIEVKDQGRLTFSLDGALPDGVEIG